MAKSSVQIYLFRRVMKHIILVFFNPLGDKVSMLTHTYPHKPLKKIEVTICNHQADSPLYVWPNV